MSDLLFANKGSASVSESVTEETRVEIYSTKYCPYCVRAKILLDSKGVDYKELRVDQDINLRQEMESRSSRKSVPQIFIGEKHIGGFDELARLEIGNELDHMLGLGQS